MRIKGPEQESSPDTLRGSEQSPRLANHALPRILAPICSKLKESLGACKLQSLKLTPSNQVLFLVSIAGFTDGALGKTFADAGNDAID